MTTMLVLLIPVVLKTVVSTQPLPAMITMNAHLILVIILMGANIFLLIVMMKTFVP
jgi:hypothetical protein